MTEAAANQTPAKYHDALIALGFNPASAVDEAGVEAGLKGRRNNPHGYRSDDWHAWLTGRLVGQHLSGRKPQLYRKAVPSRAGLAWDAPHPDIGW